MSSSQSNSLRTLGECEKADANNIAIRVSNLSKCYQIYNAPRDRLKQFIIPKLCRAIPALNKFFPTPHSPLPIFYKEFWALKDISFEIKKGETFGIIGRNGSGKSTLLQMICGTLSPTTGSIQTNGRIAALLELGAGFNAEFTGRENIYMNASVLGLSRDEIDASFDNIAAFADIGEFIEQPVKTYSSGMYVRLAFAVIAHVKADILVIDEALAVGDVFFTQKCMRFIRQFQSAGGTILFVSHDLGTVTNICQSAIMLFSGGQRNAITGSAEELCKLYINQVYDDPIRNLNVEQQRSQLVDLPQTQKTRMYKALKWGAPELNVYSVSAFRIDAEHFGKGGATIIDAGFIDDQRKRVASVTGGQEVCFIVSVRANRQIIFPAVGIMIKDRLGQYLQTEGTDRTFRHHQLVFEEGERIDVIFRFTMPILLSGQYTINVAIAEGLGHDHIQHHWIHDAIKIEAMSGPVMNGLGGLLTTDITMEFIPQEHGITK